MNENTLTGIRIIRSPRGQLGDLSGYVARGPEDFWEERDFKRYTRAIALIQDRRKLTDAVGGPLYFDTTYLPLVGGGKLGPVKLLDNTTAKWGIWFPHKRAILDIFLKEIPSVEEQEFRQNWCKENKIRYAMREPGWRFTLEDLTEWFSRKEGGA